MADTINATLRKKLQRGAGILVPGASNALMARMIQQAGFDAATVPGSGVTNCFLGAPDIGLLTLTELAQHVAAMRENLDLPLIVDADTGFGNALNAYRTVRVLEQAGANAAILEDQEFPPKGGFLGESRLISKGEMSDKIKAAADARRDGDFLVIARTDALSANGIGDALDRAAAYIDAGADLTFLVNIRNVEHMKQITGALRAPQVVNIIAGASPLMLDRETYRQRGFAMVLYANAALQAAMLAMKQVLEHLHSQGSLEGISDRLVDFRLRQDLVGKPHFDALERGFHKER